MGRYQRHIFICTNRRPPGDPKGCCADKESRNLKDRFKDEIRKRGITASVRANESGCLDACSYGAAVVVYPEGVWYGGVTPADVPEVVERHIIKGEIVERLLIRDGRYVADRSLLGPLTGGGEEKYPKATDAV